ncbi:protein SUS1 [Kluyveromyces marxianus]|uniref:Protein SUS1 n=1 Tax=Kluyveromyces marxianus TaxID=4911 RepID=A0ABX6F6D1_KLUMA|nr:protein SUS1 [Kluyveromyces marxianus]
MEDHDSKKIKAQIQQALVQSGQYEGYVYDTS